MSFNVITVARKPVDTSVSQNFLKYGTGALNIESSRIPYEEGHVPPKEANVDKPSSWMTVEYNGSNPYIFNSKLNTRQVYTSSGRYPSNLILSEESAASLDQQGDPEERLSRFFRIIDNDVQANGIPASLLEYLHTLITPQGGDVPLILRLDLYSSWGDWADGSLHGMIAVGVPSKNITIDLMRILKPGAHVLLIAPDDHPTGHKGTNQLEEGGFEIRDAIFWSKAPGDLHYVPKPSRFEREAGCGGLSGMSGAEAVDRKEGTAGLSSPRAGAGRTASYIKNFHPTVKPIALMKKLVASVKEGETVLDPFMGSGPTGIACLGTHDFIGIEIDDEYVEIADARIRYWDSTEKGWIQNKIHSEVEEDESEITSSSPPMSLSELFGF